MDRLAISGLELLLAEGGGNVQKQHSQLYSHLEISHHDLSSITLIKHTYFSVPGSVCSHFLKANSLNCGSLYHGYSLVIL